MLNGAVAKYKIYYFAAAPYICTGIQEGYVAVQISSKLALAFRQGFR